MKIATLFVLATSCQLMGQNHRTLIFAHNDYVHQRPFHESYQNQVDFIEADVFYKREKLFVAHTAREISEARTLDVMYLGPIAEQIELNNGAVYPGREQKLTLMIDLKTDGKTTLAALVMEIRKFPTLIDCKTLTIAVSGDVPPPAEWPAYPAFIYFDGRPAISYSAGQLDRVTLISASFKDYSTWNGRDQLSNADRLKLSEVIQRVHSRGKRIRFWAIPDNPAAWRELTNLGVDVINTDKVEEAVAAIRR